MTTRAQQFDFIAGGIMVDGAPITTGYVKFLAAGTSNTKNAYEDKEKAVAITKKALDAQGRATVYGDGVYKLEFYVGDPDASGVLSFTLDNIKCTAVVGKIHTITTDTTIDRDTQLVLVDTTSGDITVTLDPVANFDNEVTIKKISASNTVTVDPDGSETIDGSSTKTMTSNNVILKIYPDTSASIWRSSDFVWDDDNVSITGNLDVGGTVNGDGLDIDGTADISDTLVCSKASGAGLQVASNIDANGNQDLAGTLDIGSGTTRRVAPAGTSVNNSNGNPNISDAGFDIYANIGTLFESIGPTGSGKTNIWTDLDSVPTDADWITIRIDHKITRTSSSFGIAETKLYARKNGSSEAVGADNLIDHLACYGSSVSTEYGAGACTHSEKIPVNSAAFDLAYVPSGVTSDALIMVLVDWGFNP